MSMMDFTGVDFGFGLEGLNLGNLDLRDSQGRYPMDAGYGTEQAAIGGTGGVSGGANTKTITNTSSFTMAGREITRTTYSDGTYSDDDNGPTETLQDIYNANNAIETAQSNESMSSILAKTLEFYNITDPQLLVDIKSAVADRRLTGVSSIDDIGIQLRESPAFQARFAANEARRKAGKPVYSVTQLLQLESTYRRNLSDAGMPKGFYDDPVSLQNFIVNDVSPDEVLARVQLGFQAVRDAPKEVVNQMKSLYNIDDTQLAAFFLDPAKGKDIVLRAADAAQIAAQAKVAGGMTLDTIQAENLARAGVTAQQAQAGFSQIGQQAGLYRPLEGEQAITQEDILAGTFTNEQAAQQRIARRKRGRIAGFEAGGSFAQNQQSNIGLTTVGQ
jgi:hypothetical protein